MAKARMKEVQIQYDHVARDKQILTSKCEELTSILGQAQSNMKSYE